MSPIGIRRAIHHVYTLVALVLLATGALLTWPRCALPVETSAPRDRRSAEP